MIFWIIFGLAIIFTALAIYVSYKNKFEHKLKYTSFIAVCFAIFLWIVVTLMVIGIIYNRINMAGQKEAFEKKYESLVYQLINNMYDNENDIGKKELYNQITRWNYDLALRKRASKNFWLYIFYADIYDDLEYIELG